ncbi:hypothetical protein J1N51_11435 [Psychrosphaera ytuae]|uniref:Uncharacterized protein n=1 Tax=Psychrosphaera ytuae TaxID=2820710 RepID=A0A975DAN0_9GAMM|nr:hypothetical protein [Psychrosphaera ytuae]QTH63338.1 hypothetical protein J1N51_11435 [Psychrosphaera ytuae]
MERFIKKEDLPNSLWCKDRKIIKLPNLLVEKWKLLLEDNNLSELATKKADKGFIGGISKEETDKHLAWRYNGSCGRVILSLLDPKNQLSKVSDAYAEIFAGQRVFLADLPSGSGAAVISILTTLAELRTQSVLPRIPLDISIVAGEISESARSYLKKQLDELIEPLKEQAISFEYTILHWDVLDRINNADLIRQITIRSQNCDSRLLVVSNFSGLLEGNSKWKEAEKQISEIFIHSRDQLSAAIWIEPQKNNVLDHFFPRMSTWFKQLFKPILTFVGGESEENEPYGLADIKCEQPIKDGTFPIRLTIARFDLPLD